MSFFAKFIWSEQEKEQYLDRISTINYQYVKAFNLSEDAEDFKVDSLMNYIEDKMSEN